MFVVVVLTSLFERDIDLPSLVYSPDAPQRLGLGQDKARDFYQVAHVVGAKAQAFGPSFSALRHSSRELDWKLYYHSAGFKYFDLCNWIRFTGLSF